MRRWHGRLFRRRSRRRGGALRAAGAAGVILALALIGLLEVQLRPVVETMAAARVSNAVTQLLDRAVAAEIQARAITYSDLITMERDGTGRVTALTSNMAALNELRTGILEGALAAVDAMDTHALSIPVGNLTGINFFSGRGFEVPLEVLTVGSASGEFQSRFSEAGINQTRHQILLELTVTVDILLPGGDLRREISTQVPVAETVIVGSVPETYVTLPGVVEGEKS